MKTASAKDSTNAIDPVFAELNLNSVGSNFFIGHFEDVPFRMELVATEMTIGLLFKIRFTKAKQPIPEFPGVPADGRLQTLIEEKKADYTADQDQTWFNLFAAHELIEAGELIPVLKEFAASLKSYVDFEDQPCFACKQTKATQPIYHSEKLHLICDECHARFNEKAKIDPANVVFSLLWAVVVSVVGGVIWSLGWMAFDWIFADVRLPTIVFTLAFLALGGAVALPIAWVFKKIPRRGGRLGNVIMVFACVLTAILGEAFLCGYFVYREIHILPDAHQMLVVWRALMAEAGSFYVIGKLMTIGIMCAIIMDNSRSKMSIEEAAAPPAR
jgi:hypothetical protein